MKNGMVIDKDGSKSWWLNGERHRVDGPAVEWAYGTKAWYLNGKLHREDGPAKEWANGSKFWYLNGLLHCVDGPAWEWVDGTKFWYLNGKELIHPECFESMDAWFEYLNDNEEQTYQVIHDINGIIEIIKNPSSKQTRVHQMAHVL